MPATATSYRIPVVPMPDLDEKLRLLCHHLTYGICPASRYLAAPMELRPPMPVAISWQPVKKSQPPTFFKRLTFIKFLIGHLAA